MKKTGILMPVFSLPSPMGIGDLGDEAYRWITLLDQCGIKIWQILPLNPVGYGNSPYQPYSSCAGDELYISIEKLKRNGLIDCDLPVYGGPKNQVRYEEVRKLKEPLLRHAYRNFKEKNQDQEADYRSFIEQGWVYDYAVFRAMKAANKGVCWNEWKEEDKFWPEKRRELPEEIQEEAYYHMFLQYEFYIQWMEVKKAANDRGIEIMGDVPFYVGLDSVDVWAGRDNFLLDKDGHPIFIAGVPPDYFSTTGQRWGNPIYDWDYIKEKGYQFWVDRIGYSSRLFDIIRIDHFRAFDTYWKIPASCPTAIEGEWIEAPGYEVLDTINEKIPGVHLVAEDLGDLRPEVLTLKEHYHLKGMKILVFAIETKGKYAYNNSPDTENMILYTGTHDNDTLMEWYHGLSAAGQRKVRRFLRKSGFGNGSVKDRLVAYTLQSKAEYVILPTADFLGLGKEAHMNTPGTVGSPNWEWRMTEFDDIEKELMKYRNQIVRK